MVYLVSLIRTNKMLGVLQEVTGAGPGNTAARIGELLFLHFGFLWLKPTKCNVVYK